MPNVDSCRRWRTLSVALLLAVHALLLGWGAYVHSPTLNEPGHLVAGIRIWQSGHFDVYQVNPPLVRAVAALPVLIAGAETDWSKLRDTPGVRMEFEIGSDFVAANGERSFWLLTLARWACLPFSLLGGCICFYWARTLYGTNSGLMALALWCFCPNIIAHGQLITSDVAAAALGMGACYTFWRWLKRPSWGRTLTSGLVLGAAELAKTTLVVFYALWPIIWLLYRWPDRKGMAPRDWLRELGMLAARMGIGIYIINLGYGFEGTATRLGEFRFSSSALGVGDGTKTPFGGGNRFAETWLGSLPVPLPRNYVLGIDLQKRDFERIEQPSYLRGQLSDRGWWYFYLYALAVKVPLGTWTLIAMAAIVSFWSKPIAPLRDELVLLSPAAIILVFVSSQTGFSQHMRYVLPAFPFVFVWTSRLAAAFRPNHKVVTATALAALAWSIGSSIMTFPHSLSYFNELAGGPIGGPAHLIHSNVDWGQDLLLLKRWLQENPTARPLRLAYFGYFDPVYSGIEYTVPDELAAAEENGASTGKIPPGWYAISVNFLRGFPYPIYRGDGTRVFLPRNALAVFRTMTPVGRAGYSIFIYRVPEEP